MKRELLLGLAAGMTFLPLSFARADEHLPADGAGFYFTARIGSALPIDQDITSGFYGDGEYDPDSGIGFQGAVGKHFGAERFPTPICAVKTARRRSTAALASNSTVPVNPIRSFLIC